MDQRFKGKANTIKLSYENIGENLHSIAFGDYFLVMTPKAQATATENVDKLD